MAKPKPKVSVVVPTLNEENYLEEALISISSQKGAPEYEIIVSDGGSTDKTLGIAKKYADRIVHEPKRTCGAGRNTGMMAAKGDILVAANADTYYPQNWLQKLVAPFSDRKVVGVIGRVAPKDGDLIDKAFARAILHPAAHVLSRLRVHYVDSSNMAIARKEFLKVGGFNTDLVSGEDTELIKRMKKHGEVVYAPDAIAYISMRRVRKWGKLYFTYFHTTNFLKTHIFHRGHGHYEPIREKRK